jgi:winged helix DNA-binding protein
MANAARVRGPEGVPLLPAPVSDLKTQITGGARSYLSRSKYTLQPKARSYVSTQLPASTKRLSIESGLPGNAGWISPVVLLNGKAVGTWSYARRGNHLLLEIQPFQKYSRRVRAKIEEEAASWDVSSKLHWNSGSAIRSPRAVTAPLGRGKIRLSAYPEWRR